MALRDRSPGYIRGTVLLEGRIRVRRLSRGVLPLQRLRRPVRAGRGCGVCGSARRRVPPAGPRRRCRSGRARYAARHRRREPVETGEDEAVVFLLFEGAGSPILAEGHRRGVNALNRAVPDDGCLGALLGGDDAAFPLFGPQVKRRITYVDQPPAGGAPLHAAGIRGRRAWAGDVTVGPEWRVVTHLGGYWRLAVRAGAARPFACSR